MEKRIYFVRHGESEGNAGPMRQSLDCPLTERGREQAEFVAARVTKIPFELLVSSTLERAKETAGTIHIKTGANIVYSDLFVERRRPSITYGIEKSDPVGLEADREVAKHFTDPGYRHSDEENFDDLKARAENALSFLLSRPEQSIVVVTHGFFLRILAAVAVFGPELTSYECGQFIRALRMENTGLSVMEHSDEGWTLPIWNDHAHLG